MTLPIDLLLVRHGQSEGNAAKRLSERGEHATTVEVFKDRHTRSFRLTDLGCTQAAAAGEWIREELFKDSAVPARYYTSEYTRAMETAALLRLPEAEWFTESNLTERDWGALDALSENEREQEFGEALRMRSIEPFFWRPPNGERLADLKNRLRFVLDTLHRECSDKRVIVVCHGEVMWAFRVLLERMSQQRFKELHLSTKPEDRVHNCQIIHYTRRDPETDKIEPHANWMRMVRPTDRAQLWTTGWQRFERPRYTNAQLLETVTSYPRVLK